MATDLPTAAAITDSAVTNAGQKLNFAALRNFMANLLGTDSSDKPAARAVLGVAPRATRIDVASVAGTVDITANAPNTDDIRMTGALAITKYTIDIGRVLRVTAGGAFSMANNANIVTQTGATLTLAAGDTFQLRATAADTVEVFGLVRATGVADGSITAAKLDGGQSGSAPIFGARSWGNFNGSGTVAIRASGNLSSVTDNGTGDYTPNFTTAMPDANYGITVSVSSGSAGAFAASTAVFRDSGGTLTTPATGSFRTVIAGAGAAFDPDRFFFAVHR